jgi:hypothetical protein
MRWRVLITNGIVLAGITWMVAMGTGKQASKLLPALRPMPPDVQVVDIAILESTAALAPTSSNLAALATAYLDRNQPGLASAVLEGAPAEVRRRPEIAQLQARALFQRGRAREALATAKEAHGACLAASAKEQACPSWLIAKTARQLAFFQEVVSAGIEDPYADPSGTKAAYERSAHTMRMVAMR